MKIKATVTDESNIAKVLLYYRPTRQAQQYSILTMYPGADGLYTATIPGKNLTTEFDLMYYFEALDEFGNGTFHPDPAIEDPIFVVRVRR